ncbi:MAG: cation:proton antiporter [Flavobacteriales bacterium]|nr:cation:proton antiporter [Flavobacteriales bacterium]
MIYLAGFIVVAVASNQIAKYFTKLKLPLVTGLLATGILAGPFVLKLIPEEAPEHLFFVNDFALAFIAFAAAAELYLKELRSRMKSIKWLSIGQFVVTFSCASAAIIYLSPKIPFMTDMNLATKIAVATLAASIFVARSPASAIAVVNELRAKGPFTQTAMGVTVLADFLVIVLFAVTYSIAQALVTGIDFDYKFIILLGSEMLLAFVSGFVLGRIMTVLMSIRMSIHLKTAGILLVGYGVYFTSHYLRDWSSGELGLEIYIEPLLVCIIGSFILTNYSRHRNEFLRILETAGPPIYVIFFTLTGAAISLDLLVKVTTIAVILFTVRLLALIIGSTVGGLIAKEPWQFIKIGWMPYVTQAGVGLGLATVVANSFPGWGQELATVIIAVIVLNQIVGPPLFKWAINMAGESHHRAATPDFDGERNAVIFGLEGQSFALARQLQDHGWRVIIASRKGIIDEGSLDVDIQPISALSKEEMKRIGVDTAEAIVALLSDKENYQICEICYEHFGTKDKIVRLNDRANFDRFHDLGALIVEPTTAIVSLLDHLVRSPQAASLLLGFDENQDTVDLEVLDPNLHGMSLRELRFPTDILILAISRGGQSMVTHGYTRLRLHDTITVVGSVESIKNVELRVSAP